MSDQPLLSVIIVAYKSRDEIRDCLSSIPRALRGGPVSTLVVDNHGQDGVGEIVRTEYPHVQYVRPERNLGFGAANNLGYHTTSGKYVLFLNPDTVSNAAAYERCIQRLDADPGIGLISPRLVMRDGVMDAACRRKIPTMWDGFCRASGLAAAFPSMRLFAGYNLTYLPVEGSYEVGAINGAFMLGPRVAFENVGLFDERFFMYGDDLDLCIRFRKKGYKIIYDGSTEMIHLKGRSVNKEYETMSAAIFDANRDIYLKHFNPQHSKLIDLKYRCAFGLWKRVARLRAALKGGRRVRPL